MNHATLFAYAHIHVMRAGINIMHNVYWYSHNLIVILTRDTPHLV